MTQPLPPIKLHNMLRQSLLYSGQELASFLGILQKDERGRPYYQYNPKRPDLVIALLRAAELPCLALMTYIETIGLSRPPLIFAHIGREMFIRYQRTAGGEGSDMIFLTGTEEMVQAYAAWLLRDRYAQEVMDKMKRDAAAVGQPRPHRVMVMDDFETEGATLYSAWRLIEKALPEVKIGDRFMTHTQIDYPVIEGTFADAPFPVRDRGLYYDFLEKLLRGYWEKKNGGLLPLNNEAALAWLGKRRSFHKRQVYPTLKALYGVDNLLQFRGKVLAAMQDYLEQEALREMRGEN
jgi:hypothetical protein